MDYIDSLERPDHNFKICDQTILVPADHIHSVDHHSLNFHLKFQHGMPVSMDFAHIDKALIEEYLKGCS